ncbi:histidine kinase [Lacibacter cauensis]|uniref:Histidine kinase n=2 Tax=Lacibacter cauensis TaxID=510947 RepID=A0A562SQ18_9BACT|nr:histidine kinase [Lacibacter cauensis]
MIEKYPFLFSDSRRYQLARHASYWLFWMVFQGFLYSFVAVRRGFLYWPRLQSSFVESLIYLIPHMFLSYMLIYFVIPRYLLKQKYFATIVWVLFLFFLSALISSFLSVTLIESTRLYFMSRDYISALRDDGKGLTIFLGLMAGFRGAITIGGISAAIKLMKHWYVKEQRNLILQKENMEAQLKVLKAQIHPHFLFNTLNNIYSYTHNSSPAASKMLMELSDILRYILYEGDQQRVPLSKELKLLRDYIELEQLRYGNKLEVTVSYPSNAEQYTIAPLLLLPFVENCFKHGTSTMLENPWVSLQLHISNDTLYMKLLNGKAEQPVAHQSGIGLQNVKERLRLLYPGEHDLQIMNEPDVFIVNLKIKLELIPATQPVIVKEKTLTHA